MFAHPNAAGEPLLESLLQCDGVRVQAIVMVRDDFWMAATRFFRELDIPLLERINSAAVDLFDLDHAARELKAFGRAFGKLESDGKDDKIDRKQSITEAVNGLAEQGKVISVRLSLFAEMMKGKPWTSESLNEVGGTTGVGATFLEETFSASGAPPQHRYHQEAARSVLRALLPEAGTDIKRHKKSAEELRSACRYDSRQLTHDYLVPSLRDWLTRKQRETRKGRAELKLAERAATWSDKRENKQLPTLSEWISIRTLPIRRSGQCLNELS